MTAAAVQFLEERERSLRAPLSKCRVCRSSSAHQFPVFAKASEEQCRGLRARTSVNGAVQEKEKRVRCLARFRYPRQKTFVVRIE